MKKTAKLVFAVLAAVVISGCASTYHPVGEPRQGVVEQRVVVQ